MGYNGNEAREMIGVGGVINTKHEGDMVSRPTEKRANLDDWKPANPKTPADFEKERREKKSDAPPAYLIHIRARS